MDARVLEWLNLCLRAFWVPDGFWVRSTHKRSFIFLCILRVFYQIRWSVCHFAEVFPRTRIYAFGSSVNGFGDNSSDVDLVVDVPEAIMFGVSKRVTSELHDITSWPGGPQRVLDEILATPGIGTPYLARVCRLLWLSFPGDVAPWSGGETNLGHSGLKDPLWISMVHTGD